ncbi:MAG: LytTR family DNA-binding domain-containing protein [Bacilli bacterium]|nr:LytTR family DNA-binding domain-containing protein [Bacilli bacterium]
MIRFAIVDDNPSDASILSQYLNSYFEKLGVVFSVDTFQDGPSFLEAFHSQYDMIFLDVEMGPLDGFAVAERIREKNDSTLLVFVTNMSQLARQGYKYQAFDYLPKPSDFSEFKMTLDRAALQSKSNEDKTILLPGKNKEKTAVHLSDITYLEVNGHYITFHTTTENYVQYGVFKKVLEEISLPNTFARCNQSFVVNMRYIEKIFKDSLVINGDTLVISRPQKKSFFDAYTSYVSGRRTS